MLDDMESSVDARGFGDAFHEGIVSLIKVDYLENILVSVLPNSYTS